MVGGASGYPGTVLYGWRLEQVLVLALAANRLARAVTVDEVTRPARAKLMAWAEKRLSPRGQERLEQLIHCPVCMGWWTSIALSLVAPGRHRVRRGMAVAGAQVLLTLAERLVSERGRAAIHEADVVQAVAEGDPMSEAEGDPMSEPADGAVATVRPVRSA